MAADALTIAPHCHEHEHVHVHIHLQAEKVVVFSVFESYLGTGASAGNARLAISDVDRYLRDGASDKGKKGGKKRRASAGTSLLGSNLFQDSQRSVQEQLRDALVANSMRVIDLFREWDTDGDGCVDKEEFRRAMPMLGLQGTREHFDALFDEFDKDGSGSITFRELNRCE